MVAKKETTAVEEPTTETPTPEGDDFVTKVTAVVKDVLGELLPGKETPTPDVDSDTGKRPTARDEEERMSQVVTKAIAEFKAAQGDDKADTTTKVEPEVVPGTVVGRRVEKMMGWVKD
jgi:hypothetical protein